MDIFKVVVTFMGSFLGAGFISGAEVSEFFSGRSLWTTLLSGAIVSAGFVVFSVSERTDAKTCEHIKPAVKIFSFLSLTMSFAVAAETGKELFGSPLSPFIAAAAAIVAFDERFLKSAAFFSVCCALTAAAMAASRPETAVGGGGIGLNVVGYALMSSIVPSIAVKNEIKKMSANKIILSAVLICAAFSATAILFVFAVGENGRLIRDTGSDTPERIISLIAVTAASLTSAGAQLKTAAEKPVTKIAAAASALAASAIGIENILTWLYPVMSVIGASVLAVAGVGAIKKILVKRRRN